MLGGISTLLFSSLLAAGMVEVRGDVACPSAAEITARLQPLLPRASRDPADLHLATLADVGPQPDGRKALHLRLLRSDASVIGDRHLFLAGDCQTMAEAAAVVIAAWETEDPSVLSVDENKQEGAPAQVPARSTFQLWGGVGAGAGFVGGVAIVGNLEAQMSRSDSHWRLRVSLMREGARRLDLGSGHADWQHTMVAAGLLLQGALGAWVGSVDLGPTIGWVTVQGVGFQNNQESNSLEYGVVGGMRAGRRLGRWILWAEGRAHAWLRGQRALLTNLDSRVEMPQADVSASLGTTFLFF